MANEKNIQSPKLPIILSIKGIKISPLISDGDSEYVPARNPHLIIFIINKEPR
jgi:hypothetical protein